MPKSLLFIASTLDGFIARSDGSLDWLNNYPDIDKYDYGYLEFIKGVDTLFMGRKTYEEVLSFGVDWPYAGCQTYVVTSAEDYKCSTPDTIPLNDISKENLRTLVQSAKKDSWVVGGGTLISHFLQNGLIDEMTISIVPIILGSGIPLFPNQPKETAFQLITTETFDTGIVNFKYKAKDQ